MHDHCRLEQRTAATTEIRTVTADVQNVRAEGHTLFGHAALYGVESRPIQDRELGRFTETIAAGAFTDVLASAPDVVLTLNHDESRVLARTSSGTLRLRDESQGLAFEADLGDGPTADDVRSMVRRGDLTGMSFRFRVAPEGESWQGERRTLTRVEHLADLSLATTPAYNGPHGRAAQPARAAPRHPERRAASGPDHERRAPWPRRRVPYQRVPG